MGNRGAGLREGRGYGGTALPSVPAACIRAGTRKALPPKRCQHRLSLFCDGPRQRLGRPPFTAIAPPREEAGSAPFRRPSRAGCVVAGMGSWSAPRGRELGLFAGTDGGRAASPAGVRARVTKGRQVGLGRDPRPDMIRDVASSIGPLQPIHCTTDGQWWCPVLEPTRSFLCDVQKQAAHWKSWRFEALATDSFVPRRYVHLSTFPTGM